jgi:membrane protease YdiL (CAAX protease family)
MKKKEKYKAILAFGIIVIATICSAIMAPIGAKNFPYVSYSQDLQIVAYFLVTGSLVGFWLYFGKKYFQKKLEEKRV